MVKVLLKTPSPPDLPTKVTDLYLLEASAAYFVYPQQFCIHFGWFEKQEV
jgi:hypothetical protein